MLKKKRKEKTSKKKLFVVGAVIVAAISLVLLLQYFNSYKFVISRNGVTYYSNEYFPATFFEEFRKEKTVYVSQIQQEGNPDSLVSNASQLWVVVLNGHDVNTVLLIQGVDSQKNLVNCYTNWGDVKTNEKISAEQCKDILENPEKMKVVINVGNQDGVILSKGKLETYSSTTKAMGQLNLAVIKEIYPDAEQIIASVNNTIGRLN